MEIKCPSCGTTYRSEDYPGAFDIPCKCGYSILVPDEASFAIESVAPEPEPVPEPVAEPAPAPAPKARKFSEPVAASESVAEEEAIEASATPDSLFSEPAAMDTPDAGVTNLPMEMTPPENLPEGMVYDPFELPQNSESAAATEQNSSAPMAVNAEPPTRSGQALVERIQAASMGQLLGSDYELKPRGLSREALNEVARRCAKLIKQRPWLETELRNRRLDIEKLSDQQSLTNVPELVAVEIYLACYEMGGSCEFQRIKRA